MPHMTTSSTADIRDWARAAGLTVGERGRLSPEIIAAYHAAHAEQSPSPATAADHQQQQAATVAGPHRTVRAKQHWDWARREAE